jgi:hypothetical protein
MVLVGNGQLQMGFLPDGFFIKESHCGDPYCTG